MIKTIITGIAKIVPIKAVPAEVKNVFTAMSKNVGGILFCKNN